MVKCGIKTSTGRCVKHSDNRSDECTFRDRTSRCIKIREEKVKKKKIPVVKPINKPVKDKTVKPIDKPVDKIVKNKRKISELLKDCEESFENCDKTLITKTKTCDNQIKKLKNDNKKLLSNSKELSNVKLLNEELEKLRKQLKSKKPVFKDDTELLKVKKELDDLKTKKPDDKELQKVKKELSDLKTKKPEKGNINCDVELEKLKKDLDECRSGFYNQFKKSFEDDWTKYNSSDSVYLNKYLNDPNRSTDLGSLEEIYNIMQNPEFFQWKTLAPLIEPHETNALKLIINDLNLGVDINADKDVWLKKGVIAILKNANKQKILSLPSFRDLIVKIISVMSKRVSTFIKIFNPSKGDKCESQVFEDICDIQQNTLVFKKEPKPTSLGYKINKEIEVTETFAPKDGKINVQNNDIYKSALLSASLNTALQGKKIVVFNYGFSGAGKTHTSFNKNEDDSGIFIRFINDNKDKIEKITQGISYGKINQITFKKGVIKSDAFSDNDFYEKLSSETPSTKPEETNFAKQSFYNFVSEIDVTDKVLNTDFDLSETKNLLKIHTKPNISGLLAYSNFVSATVNNPESSRGHLFYRISFKLQEDAEAPGELLYYDLAGSEKPEEIFKMFSGDQEEVDIKSLRRLIENVKSLFGLSSYQLMHVRGFKNAEEKRNALNTVIDINIANKKGILFEGITAQAQRLKPWAKILVNYDGGKMKLNPKALDWLDIILESFYINKSLHELRKFLKAFINEKFSDTNKYYANTMSYFFGHNLAEFDKALVIGHIRADGDPVNDIIKYEGTINTLYFIEEIMKGGNKVQAGGQLMKQLDLKSIKIVKKYLMNIFVPLYVIKFLRFRFFDKCTLELNKKLLYDGVVNTVLAIIFKLLKSQDLLFAHLIDYVVSLTLFYTFKNKDLLLPPYFMLNLIPCKL
jgi:hypothetical protein